MWWYLLNSRCPLQPAALHENLKFNQTRTTRNFKTSFQSSELWSTQTFGASQSQTQWQTFWIRCQALLCILRANLGVIGRVKSTTGVKCRGVMHLCCMGKPWASEPWCSHPDIQLRITAFCFSVWPEFPVSISTVVTTYYNWWPVKGLIHFLTSVKHLTQITRPRFTPAVRRLLQHISLRAPWRPPTAPRQKIISSSRMLKAEMSIHWRRVQHLFNTCLHFPLFLPCLCMFFDPCLKKLFQGIN